MGPRGVPCHDSSPRRTASGAPVLYLLKASRIAEYHQQNVAILGADEGERFVIRYGHRWVQPGLQVAVGDGTVIVFSDTPYRDFVPVRFAKVVRFESLPEHVEIEVSLGPWVHADDRSVLSRRWGARTDADRPGKRFLISDANPGLRSPASRDELDAGWRARGRRPPQQRVLRPHRHRTAPAPRAGRRHAGRRRDTRRPRRHGARRGRRAEPEDRRRRRTGHRRLQAGGRRRDTAGLGRHRARSGRDPDPAARTGRVPGQDQVPPRAAAIEPPGVLPRRRRAGTSCGGRGGAGSLLRARIRTLRVCLASSPASSATPGSTATSGSGSTKT